MTDSKMTTGAVAMLLVALGVVASAEDFRCNYSRKFVPQPNP
jgi:hypothetical protein